MKFFTNKSIWTKIVIVLIFVILFEFIIAKPTLADDKGVDTGIEFAGKLMSPILSLVVTIADAAMEIAQSSIMGTDESLLEADLSSAWYEVLGTIFKVAIVVGLFIIAPVATTIAVIANTLISAAVGVDLIGSIGDKLYDTGMEAIGISSVRTASFVEANLPETLYLPAYSLTPEEIFKGNVLMFNVDFFGTPKQIQEHTSTTKDKDGNDVQQVDYYYYVDDEGNEVKTSKQDIGQQLGTAISSWYVSIRNIALVCMMIVLLYIGIRMLLSTLASDKAKYKQMLQDWLVGLLLLFLMHYIMAFSVTIVQKLTDIVSASVDSNAYTVIIPNDSNNKLRDFVKDAGMQDYIVDSSGAANPDASGTDAYIMYPTNMMGYLRLKLQLSNWGSEYVGLAICFVILVMFTIFFVFTYLRRVLYMAFLTLIAPIVAVTYPIDKINDGSAQGFSRWFREYIFNLLIQPMHLLLYFILVSSAFEMASENIIYSLVAIGFMMPAEKLLRSLFGFEKSNTSSALSAAAGGALAMTGISKLASIAGGGKKGKTSSSSGKDSSGSSGDNGGGNVREAKNPLEGDISSTDTIDRPSEIEAQKVDDETERLDADQKALDEMKGDITSDEDRQYIEEEQERINNERAINVAAEARNKELAQQEQEEDRQETAKYAIPVTMPERAKRKIHNFRTNSAYRNAVVRYYGGKAIRQGIVGGAKTIQYGARAAGGIAFASAGLAAGVASGDPSKALSYVGAGATAGYMAGKGATANLDSKAKGLSVGSKSREEYYSNLVRTAKDDKTREVAEQQVMEIKSKEYKKAFEKNGYDKNTINDMMKKGTINRYIKNDISAEDAVAAERMREDTGMTQKQVILSAKYADRVGDAYKGADAAKWKKQFSEEYQEKMNMNKEQADKAARETWKKVGDYRKYKKKVVK